jgi:hypothetical protein
MYTYLSTNWLQQNDATCGGSLKISISLTRGGSVERSNMWRKVSTTKNTQYTFHKLALFITDTNVYVKDILLSTNPPLVRDLLIFGDPHTTHPSYLSGPMDTKKVKVQFSPIVLKKLKIWKG